MATALKRAEQLQLEVVPKPGGFAADVYGFDIEDEALCASSALRERLFELIREHQVLAIRSPKRMTDEQQARFAKIFGTPHVFSASAKGEDDSFVQHIHGNPFSYWHQDIVDYATAPCQFTILHCLVNPVRVACDTVFVNNFALLRKLPDQVLSYLKSRTVFTQPSLLVGRDPVSERETLFYNFGNPYIALMRECFARGRGEEAQKVFPAEELEFLKAVDAVAGLVEQVERAEAAEEFFRMRCSEGDTVIWNNLTVGHRGGADKRALSDNRWMRRSLVLYGGELPDFYRRFGVLSNKNGAFKRRQAGY
ncbi:MAG TPA: TauD/TfdA family dioxygenase [Bdellovibrionales bacterium]|nr:TauD/TfdA family dioxygenase [Bdellovibrionales bacterium]